MAQSKSDQQSTGQGSASPGQLLAARKAAKAAKKAAKRGRQAEVRESDVLRATAQAADWARENRTVLWVSIAAIAVVIGGLATWSHITSKRAHDAADLLWEASRAADAPLEGAFGAVGNEEETFTSVGARARAAAKRFDKVLERYPHTAAAAWARIGRANALLQEGKTEYARVLFKQALDDADTVTLKWRALEGLAQTYEADRNWTEAQAQYRAMSSLADARIKLQARYGLARTELAQGDQNKALRTLKDLRSDLHKEDAPELPSLSREVDTELAYLDPGSVPAGSGGGERLTPAQLRQLIERLKAAKEAGGGPAGQGAGGAGE